MAQSGSFGNTRCHRLFLARNCEMHFLEQIRHKNGPFLHFEVIMPHFQTKKVIEEPFRKFQRGSGGRGSC